MTVSLIHDGYMLESTLPAIGPWQAVKFRYRPALAEDVMEFIYQRDQVQGKAQIKPLVEFLSRHLVGWDVRDAKGDVQPVTPDILRRMPQPLLMPLLDRVMGYGDAQAVDVKNSVTASG